MDVNAELRDPTKGRREKELPYGEHRKSRQ